MSATSAGLLMIRKRNAVQEFFLIHPGGPYYQNKHFGVWSIPKGLPENTEDLLQSAIREFQEETGITPIPPYFPLETTRLKSGKVIHAWAFYGDWNESQGIISNTFPMEWPPRSKKIIQVPEADKATWAPYNEACQLIHPAQIVFLTRALTFRSGM
jgi:predicted NUDIX family NTP pyrophosphohydrolase